MGLMQLAKNVSTISLAFFAYLGKPITLHIL